VATSFVFSTGEEGFDTAENTELVDLYSILKQFGCELEISMHDSELGHSPSHLTTLDRSPELVI